MGHVAGGGGKTPTPQGSHSPRGLSLKQAVPKTHHLYMMLYIYIFKGNMVDRSTAFKGSCWPGTQAQELSTTAAQIPVGNKSPSTWCYWPCSLSFK